jgi:hypothetical protein
LLNQKIQASNVITSLKDKEVLGTNGYAVLPFEQPTQVYNAKAPEVAQFEPLPEEKMRTVK